MAGTDTSWELAADLDRLDVLPPRAESAAFLAWAHQLRAFTHDDLPPVLLSDPSLFVLTLAMAGPGFPWETAESAEALLDVVDPADVCARFARSRAAVRACSGSPSIERLLRFQHVTGLVARELARDEGSDPAARPFACYTLGMTRRLGEIAVLSVVKSRAARDRASEGSIASVSPPEIAARLAARWGLPSSLVTCFRPAATRTRVPDALRASVEIVLAAEDIVRALPSLGLPSARTVTVRRPARLRISKERLETIVWGAFAEAAALARLLHPWSV